MVKVLMAVTEEAAKKNPYLLQLATGLQDEGITVRFWDWSGALLGNPDIIHVHWPELLYKGRSRWMTAAKSALTCLLLIKCWIYGIPIVWTIHNQEPHNKLSRFSRLVDTLVRKNIAATISINEADFKPKHVQTSLNRKIPHGHYIEWFKNYSRVEPVAMRACFVGQIRPYKGVIELLDEFRKVGDQEATLCIAGEPSPAELRQKITDQVGADPRIEAKLRFLSDRELVETVTASSLVILPYMHMFNSGALLLALSLGRPVLVPATQINLMMQAEFGSTWVRLYEGAISADNIYDALQRGLPSDNQPDLALRDWASVSRQHRMAYSAASDHSRRFHRSGKKIG